LRDAGTQYSCGEERADDKHLALRQPCNAPKKLRRQQGLLWGELRFGLRFHCQHARVKFGRRKWLAATIGAAEDHALSYSRCIVVQPKFDQCSLSRTKMNRLPKTKVNNSKVGCLGSGALENSDLAGPSFKNEAVSQLSIAFARKIITTRRAPLALNSPKRLTTV
jgi:hypothetical protein